MGALNDKRNFTFETGDAGSFEWAEALLAATGRLTPEQVALVLERNPATPLTRTLRHYLIRLKRRDRRPGVKPRNAAAWEFILFDAKALYEAKLREFRDGRPGAGADAAASGDCEAEASEHAYRAVLAEMKANLSDMDWTALRNLISLHVRDPHLFVKFDTDEQDGPDQTPAPQPELTLPAFINDNGAGPAFAPRRTSSNVRTAPTRRAS